jgi:hypothetical protein
MKGRAAMQAACNRAKWAHLSDFQHAHASCNRRAGRYVQATAPPLAPLSCLLESEPVPRLEATQQRQLGATVNAAKNGPTVMAVAGGSSGHVVSQAYVPSWGSERALSHGVKTARPCSVPRTARARATAASRTTRPVALTPRRDRRRLWQGKRATLRLRHNDRVKKGTPCHSISCPFSFPLSLFYNRDRERGIPRKGPFSVKETGSEPPY